MAEEKPITILIAEDQAITRFGLRCALEAYPELKVVAECADGMSAVLQALAVKPAIVLMDIGLPKIDGIKAAREIKHALPSTRIIMFTASADDHNIYEALELGADGYCLKTVAGEHLYSAIKAVTSGATWLDPGIAHKLLKVQDYKHHEVMPLKLPNNTELSAQQVSVLKMLSGGSKLEDVAKNTGMSLEAVGAMVQGTLAQLLSAANQELYNKIDTPAMASHQVEDTVAVKALMPSGQIDSKSALFGDRYVIDGVLGRGGMGVVYRGRHLLMDRPVAIKMLHPEFAEDEQIMKRFQTEAQTLSQVSHPNLVGVFDFGITAHGEPFMVMDYHQGQSLENYLIANGPLPVDFGRNVFTQVCEALSAVHSAGIVHRDIKPSNIIVSRDNPPVVKLVDFGIAKSVSSSKEKLKLTMTGEVVGTPRYMSPEQCTGRELDARSDIYALGCVMYECFTGKPTFEGDSFYDMVRQHVNDAPSRLPFFQPHISVPKALVELIFKALKKDPNDRFQTAEEMGTALHEATKDTRVPD
jgi:DNA-binding NarL/FixJ family response regulator